MAVSKDFDYVVRASTTRTFGRVLLSAGTNHVVVDGPAQNGCPGEAITPAELFLGGVAACAAELVEVLARNEGAGLTAVNAEIAGSVDRAHELRSDVTVFSAVALHFTLEGVDDAQARDLVEQFKGR
jgi:uncharacterized OsmC-like protein